MSSRDHVVNQLFALLKAGSEQVIAKWKNNGHYTAIILEYPVKSWVYVECKTFKMVFLDEKTFLNNERVFRVHDIVMSEKFQYLLREEFFKKGFYFRCFRPNYTTNMIEVCWGTPGQDSIPAYWQQHIALTKMFQK